MTDISLAIRWNRINQTFDFVFISNFIFTLSIIICTQRNRLDNTRNRRDRTFQKENDLHTCIVYKFHILFCYGGKTLFPLQLIIAGIYACIYARPVLKKQIAMSLVTREQIFERTYRPPSLYPIVS